MDEYLKDRNATQAAIRAGYSKKTAQEQSSRLLSNVMVSDLVREKVEAASKDAGIDRDMVLKELSKGAFMELPTEGWRPADKLKALEIIAKLLGMLDGNSKDDGRDKQSDAKRILDAVERVKERRKANEPSDKSKVPE